MRAGALTEPRRMADTSGHRRPSAPGAAAPALLRRLSLLAFVSLLPVQLAEASSEVLLFEGVGTSDVGKNVWHGWYNAGSAVAEGTGKRWAYDTAPLTALNFSDDAGRWATYQLMDAYRRRTLLDIVQSCMQGALINSPDPVWVNGHCTIGELWGSSGIEHVAQELRLGVGDGAAAEGDQQDWALFMLQAGNGDGDFGGTGAYAFGSEKEANTGHLGQIFIRGTECEVTTTTVTPSPLPWVRLFAGQGKSPTWQNIWTGWYNSGNVVEDGDGKYAAYDDLKLTSLRFHDQAENWAEYNLHDGYRGRTLLQIVQGCLGDKRLNRNTDTWLNGHCSVGSLIASNGLSKLASELRLGVGDAAGDSRDWALFMLQEGNGDGDFKGTDVYAFGSESETNTGAATGVFISGRAWQDAATVSVSTSEAVDSSSAATSTATVTQTVNALFQAVPNLFEGQTRPVWQAPEEDWNPKALLFNLTFLAHFADTSSAFLDSVADTSTMLLTSMLLQKASLMRIQATGLKGFSGAGALVLEFATDHSSTVEAKLAAFSNDHSTFINRLKAELSWKGFVVPESLRATVDPVFRGPEKEETTFADTPWHTSPAGRWAQRSLPMILLFCGLCFLTCCLIGIWSGCHSLNATKPLKKPKEMPDLEGMEATCPPPLAVHEPVTFSLGEARMQGSVALAIGEV